MKCRALRRAAETTNVRRNAELAADRPVGPRDGLRGLLCKVSDSTENDNQYSFLLDSGACACEHMGNPMEAHRAGLAFVIVVTGLAAGSSASAQDIFEIQVYDSEVAAPMRPGIETHMNVLLTRDVVTDPAGELPTNRVGHITWEPHLGLTRWAELGMYFITAIRPEGRYDVAGGKLRLKLRWPTRLGGGLVGLALNQEVGVMAPEYEASRFAWEIRPVIDLRWRWFYASVNPILSVPLRGAEAGHVEFEPAVKLAFSPRPWLALGAEYYAGLGPLFTFSAVPDQRHWLFAAVDLSGETRAVSWAVNLAVGHGLVGPEDWLFKVIVGIDLN